jgi:hypothetical protein
VDVLGPKSCCLIGETRPGSSAESLFAYIHTAGVASSKLALPTRIHRKIKGLQRSVVSLFSLYGKSTGNLLGRYWTVGTSVHRLGIAWCGAWRRQAKLSRKDLRQLKALHALARLAVVTVRSNFQRTDHHKQKSLLLSSQAPG